MKRPRSTLVTLLMLVVLPAAVALGITLLVLNIVDGRDEPETLMLPTFSSTALIPARGELQDVPAAATTGEGEEAPAAEEGAGEAPAEGGPCENPVHLVEAGETLGSIAEGFGLALDDVTAMNQMIDPAFDPNFLSIGQQIVVPVCGLPTPTPAPTPTETPVPTREIPTPGPTATDRPGRAEVEIARVLNPGDVTSEAVEIINRGTSVARLGGWQLVNQRTGEAFTFPPLNLFPQGAVTVYSGVGENTAIDIYWGRDAAVWEPGDTIRLLDPDEIVRSRFEIPD
jgi:hypothetical protein